MREASRSRILKAALEVFARYGYGGASTRRIAQRARISPGLIYAYFRNKQALLEALFAQSMEDVRASFAAAEAERDAGRRVDRLVRASFAILRQNRDFWRLSYGIRMQAASLRGLERAVLVWQQEIVHTLTRYLRDAGVANAAVQARLLFAEIDGVAQHYVLDPRGYPLDAVLDTMIARYENDR